MEIRTVRAVLHFKTPTFSLCKHVNWSYYEAQAMLTTSTTATEAFNRFLINAKRIINASRIELRYLHTIYFYEDTRQKKGYTKKQHNTKAIEIGKNMELKVLENTISF